jgi:hypothetical protein
VEEGSVNRGSLRLAALSGVGFFTIGMIGRLSYPRDLALTAQPAAVEAFYADHHARILASDMLYLLSAGLLMVFAGSLYAVLRHSGGDDGLATMVFGAMVAGAALMLAAAAIDMAGGVRGHGQGTVVPQAASVLWSANHELVALAAPIPFAVAVLGCALAAFRDRALPVWLGAASVVLGVALAIPPLGSISIVVFGFWAFTTSLVLVIRESAGAPTAPERAPAAARG